MGLLDGILKVAAPVLGGLLGGSGSKQTGNQTVTTKHELDPRAQAIIYGSNGQNGLLSQYQALGQQPQSAGLGLFGQAADNYIGKNTPYDLGSMRDASQQLMGSNISAPQGQAAYLSDPTVYAKGNMIEAPGQNNLNLTSAYDRMINGNAGANPYLTDALQGGINQSKQMFDRMQQDSTRNLTENVLGSVRSNSVLAGQYGGSRQAIAEKGAIDNFTREQQRAIQNFGDNNTAATVGAQAQAFDRGQDRSLAAMQGLSAQQYATAAQNAATKNAAEFMNVNEMFNRQNTRAGMEQQMTLANLGAQQQTNSLNSANKVAGIGAQSGLLGQAVAGANYQDNYGLNKAAQTNSLLAPYLGAGGSTTQTTPIYQNTAGNALGGAMAGLGLYNQFKSLESPPKTGGNPFAGTGW